MNYRVEATFRRGKFISGPMSHGEAIKEACDIVNRTGNVTDVRIVKNE